MISTLSALKLAGKDVFSGEGSSVVALRFARENGALEKKTRGKEKTPTARGRHVAAFAVFGD